MKISIESLQISYDNRLIAFLEKFDSESGDFCLLTGHSGSGKSSFLKYLAMDESVSFQGVYKINDDDMSLLSNQEKNEYRFSKIAYVSQDNMVFDYFTGLENLHFFCKCGYEKINEEKIKYLVEELNLKGILSKKAKKMSGGEKQRLAIACAILKNSDLYLFDEPTSMIDLNLKQKVVDLLELLSREGKIVVVISHEQELFRHNKEYVFEDGNVLLKKNETRVNEYQFQKTIVPMAKLRNYFTTHQFFSKPYMNAVFIVLVSFCISLILSIFSFSSENVANQKELGEIVNNPEIFVINSQDFGEAIADYYGYLSLDTSTLDKIKQLDHIEAIEPFLYFPYELFSLKEGDKELTSIGYYDGFEITLYQDDLEIASMDYWDAFCEESGKPYAIYPTYSHYHLEEDCVMIFETEEQGIYISERVANQLGIEKLTGQQINLSFNIPIASDPGIYWESMDNNRMGFCRGMFGVYTNETYIIKGVFKDLGYYKYDTNYQPDFFMDINQMKEMQLEAYHSKKSVLTELTNTPMKSNNLKKYYPTRLIDDSMWQCSSYIISVDDPENLDTLVKEISLLDAGLSVVITEYGMSIVDNELISNVWKTAITYSLGVMSVLVIAIVIVKYYNRKLNLKNNLLLKQNGFSTDDIKRIELGQSVIESGCCFVLINLFTVLLIGLINKNFNFEIEYNFVLLLSSLIMPFALILICNYLSRIIYEHKK